MGLGMFVQLICPRKRLVARVTLERFLPVCVFVCDVRLVSSTG